MLSVFPTIESIHACEPDPRTFRKLSAFAEECGKVKAIPCALSDRAGTMAFHTSGSRGSGGSGANRRGADTEVCTETIDRLCTDFHPDLIKLDVEGWEAEALCGARETILRDRPALAVSLYHRAWDLFALPLWLKNNTAGAYTWHLRRVPCYPAWDLMLYAIPLG
jgi:FkbM family methyltransferase